ncbi:MAG: penicillin-binding protein 2 [Cyanobacteria bacterium P01_H01_bin.58]
MRQRQRRLRSRYRLFLIWGLLVVVGIGLTCRIAQLQILQGSTLASIAQHQQAEERPQVIARNPIVDRLGTPLAVDRLVYTLYGHPALFRQPISIMAQTLSPLLDSSPAAIAERLKQQNTGVRLLDGIPEETARRIQQLRLDGLELVPTHQRFYPQQDLFSQIVGFVNLEGQAQTGIEAQYEDRLQDAPSLASRTHTVAEPIAYPANPAALQLQLTLDSRLQRVVQQSLRQTLRQFGAKRGVCLVMDVHTGALHALAVEPTFDPNRYFDADLAWLKNWAVTDVFEPGSTLKPINIAIALEAGVITPEEQIYDEGRIIIDEWTIQNANYESAGPGGWLTITDILKHSSNVGMVNIMEKLPAQEFYEWLEKLEIDEPTGIELPAENAVPLKDKSQFVNSTVDVATTAFGQGISLTPIKLLQLQATIANGGKLVTPYVVEGVFDEAGTAHWQPSHPQPKQVFAETTTQPVLKMMEAVVEEGSGKRAQVPGYRIAGKTGTAQKATEAGTYGDTYITSFIGLLPAQQPRFAVLALVDEPLGEDVYGSTVSAPLVKTVIETLAVLEGIPPSSPQALGGRFMPEDEPNTP